MNRKLSRYLSTHPWAENLLYGTILVLMMSGLSAIITFAYTPRY